MNAESDGGGAEDSDGEDDIMVDIVNIGGLVVMERFDASWQVKIPKIAPLLKATTNGAFVRWKGRSKRRVMPQEQVAFSTFQGPRPVISQ